MQHTETQLDPADTNDFRRLLRALRRARGFALYFVECNVPVEAVRIAARVTAALTRPVVEFTLTPETDDPYPAIARAAADAAPDAALFIHGLPRVLSISAPERARGALAWLNWRRTDYRDLRRPLVFWVSTAAVTALARGAPDFFDWNSGIYRFDVPPPVRDAAFATTALDFGEFSNLDLTQRRERLALLQGLEQEYAGDGPAALRARAEVTFRLGQLHASVGDYPAAREAFERARHLFATLGDDAVAAHAAYQIASLDVEQGYFDKALQRLRGEVLPVYERLGDQRARAVMMGQIADILAVRGETDEALRIRRDEQLPVFERLGDVRSRAIAMGRIANVLETRGELDEALRIRRDEQIPVYERLGDMRSRAVTMGGIASILQARGELDAALRIHRDEVLPVYERLGDARARAVTLGHIADILEARGELDESLTILQEQVLPVFERLGARRELAVGRTNLAVTYLRRGQPGDRERATALLRQALSDAEAMGLPAAEHIRDLLVAEGLTAPRPD